ncbi:olfactory receptor 5B21-like [Tachyglossus aculeatus]|uniref:olfactory receptor 5B21-like n=1 Tax=Tachyglossus aculeatus TaxID=9261 RepID=UPI0018F7CBCC|nr:olfactory receptor 5B21-like [Tachyglossus aculeatus]
MGERNRTSVTGFLLMGLLDRPEVRFAAFDAIYSATLLANGALLFALRSNHRLHVPMSFLITKLSLLDVSLPMAFVPKLYFLVAPAGMDVLLLAATASDRHMAVLHPLRFVVLMDERVCVTLAAGAWPARFLNSPLHVSFTFTLTFTPLQPHGPVLLSRPCLVLSVGEIGAFSFILGSYILVAAVILKSRWAEGKRQVWSTCSS